MWERFARYDPARSVDSNCKVGMKRLRSECAIVAFACLLVGGGIETLAAGAKENIFESTNLLRISIEIPASGVAELRKYAWTPDNTNRANRPKVLATVREGAKVYTNVTIHSKGGYGSFQSIDRMPSLTLNFDRAAPGQKFHGLSKISLNNSNQDPTCIHEKLCRELFEAAGVPVPRSDYTVVTLNGRKLGLYVLTEGYNTDFLSRYFERTEGNLYDGGYLQDIDRPLEVNSGKRRGDYSALQRLNVVLREGDPVKRFQSLEQWVDLDRFISMVAMEVMLCHWDSYSMNRNNYRVYHDPKTDKVVFMPHGMDQVLGIDRDNLDLPVTPTMVGMVAKALMNTPQGRQRYIERFEKLFTELFREERLIRRVREIDTKIAPELQQPEKRWTLRSKNPRAFIKTSGDHATDVEELCQRISRRAENISKRLARLQK
jgi:spore coat protein H